MVRTPSRQATLFRKRIADVDQRARHGDLVQVLLPNQEVLGYGLYNPRAEATLRMLTWQENLPTADWWRAQLARAIRLRTDLDVTRHTNACRLVHAGGDGLPGLVVDKFDQLLVLEASALGMFQRGEALAAELLQLTKAKHWIVRPGTGTVETEGFEHPGMASEMAPPRQEIQEHRIRYELDLSTGHKTGFFCDQRDNRFRIRELAAGKTVLDACCYTGGFALNAAAAGAREVTAVDLDEQVIETAKRNSRLNQLKVRFVHADAFAYLRDMQRNGRTFEVVVLDPPKLIRGREEYEAGLKTYYDLNRLAASLVAPDGWLVTCSCSGLLSSAEFEKTVTAAVPFDRQPRLVQRTAAGADHPVALNVPESEYLKCCWIRL
jgi:23S rRNA (cytosine1962-C5)-methyltransferase